MYTFLMPDVILRLAGDEKWLFGGNFWSISSNRGPKFTPPTFAVPVHRPAQPAGDADVRLTLLIGSTYACSTAVTPAPQNGSGGGVAAICG